MGMFDATEPILSIPAESAVPRRRIFLAHLIALPVFPAVLSGWWARSSNTVVIRDGWVLSKDD